MENYNNEIPEINTVVGKGMLVCDYCKEKKQCEKISYNKFGNVIFVCEKCKKGIIQQEPRLPLRSRIKG